MFICIILLIILLPVAVLRLTLKSFSPNELIDMGIYLENPLTSETPDLPTRPMNGMPSRPSCLSSGMPDRKKLLCRRSFKNLSTRTALNSPPVRGVFSLPAV